MVGLTLESTDTIKVFCVVPTNVSPSNEYKMAVAVALVLLDRALSQWDGIVNVTDDVPGGTYVVPLG